MKRRLVLSAVVFSVTFVLRSTGAQAAVHAAALLRKGACALMLRHAQTEPGVGDPPGYRLDECSTQRNLSIEGREQSKQIGQWFKAHRLKPRSVHASAWCRCKDTAELAFGRYELLGALNSTFDNRGLQDGQSSELRTRLQHIPAGQFEVWVTHQVNITAMTGEIPAMGEAMLVDRHARLLGKTFFSL